MVSILHPMNKIVILLLLSITMSPITLASPNMTHKASSSYLSYSEVSNEENVESSKHLRSLKDSKTFQLRAKQEVLEQSSTFRKENPVKYEKVSMRKQQEQNTQRQLPVEDYFRHMSDRDVMILAGLLFLLFVFLSCCCCCNTNLCQELVCLWALWELCCD